MDADQLLESGHIRRTEKGVCADVRLRVYPGGQCTVDLRRSERPIAEIPNMFNNQEEALAHVASLLGTMREALED
jgi:hypothetical protein